MVFLGAEEIKVSLSIKI